MTHIERIKALEGDKTKQRSYTSDQMDYMFKAFEVMYEVALEMADYASGGNSDYGTIKDLFEEAMNEDV